ncbi:hypothetical protein F4553_001237 [Allocatelliglobosispora scoriae]|uniref:BatC protein n=1 Tax=Allocatelliglobosispora scoriae TaxID=643052 RepID=A0A841BKH5_9ACTN|nr:hypothetical protein [Allocatelliglobosispora scoriae]
MMLNDGDITTTDTTGTEGPADAGAGQSVDPQEQDGGADAGADTEGPEDAGADDAVDPTEHDGGADSGA